MYCNFQGFHSIVLFGIADANYRFIYIDVGAYGTEGDANVFANSSFGKAIIADSLRFPPNMRVGNEDLPFFFIGDDAFPLQKRLIKPYTFKRKKTYERRICF